MNHKKLRQLSDCFMLEMERHEHEAAPDDFARLAEAFYLFCALEDIRFYEFLEKVLAPDSRAHSGETFL